VELLRAQLFAPILLGFCNREGRIFLHRYLSLM
jgi:hypothetical protein